MSDIGGEIMLIVLLIAFNGVLAMSEIAVVSARKARLRHRADRGDARAATALDLAEEPTRFLSTVQVGITLVGIFAGAFGGATLAEKIGGEIERVPALVGYGHEIALALVVASITYLSLIFGELVPKRIGLSYAEDVAVVVARPMRQLARVGSPIVGLLGLSTDVVLRLLRVRPSADATVTEDEVKLLIAEGAEAGVFDMAEREIVESVFDFADRRADELMVPRPRIVWLDIEDPPEVRWRRIADRIHSYYPVARGDLDQLLGVVSAKRLFAALLTGQTPDLLANLEPATIVPETMTALHLLETLKGGSPRLAIVVQEHGTIVGLVTPTDILEAIVGDLPEPGAEAVASAVQREDGTWLVDGLLPIEDLEDLFGGDSPTPAERREFRTVGGLVMHLLARLPVPGDSVMWRGCSVEVVDMDGRRVDKLLVVPPPGAAASPASATRPGGDSSDTSAG